MIRPRLRRSSTFSRRSSIVRGDVRAGSIATGAPSRADPFALFAAGDAVVVHLVEERIRRDARRRSTTGSVREGHGAHGGEPRVALLRAEMGESRVDDESTHGAHEQAMKAFGLQFVSYDVSAVPNALTDRLRDTGTPVLTWTVRTPAQADRTFRHADQMTFEGFDPRDGAR